MIAYILAGIIGALIVLLKSQWSSSRKQKEIDDLESKVNQEKGKVSDAQAEADKAVQDYLKSLGDIDDSNGGHA